MAATMTKKLLLFDVKSVQDLIPMLKPAFEQDFEQLEEHDDQVSVQGAEEDLSQLSVSSSTSCSTCGVNFDSIQDQRQHFKLDWHRRNISNKLKGLKPISEDQFEAQLDNADQVSLSGSDSEESEHEPTEDEILTEKTLRHPKVFFTHTSEDQKLYSIHKAIMPDFNIKSRLKWAILMLGGGHFAGAIFEAEKAILHKTFHCYTVRAKQGGSQGSADNRGGNHKSAGAALRRYNENSLIQHVQEIMETWRSDLQECSLIFTRAVSSNRKVIYGKNKDGPLLNKDDTRYSIHTYFMILKSEFSKASYKL
jgi:hypothetical protein